MGIMNITLSKLTLKSLNLECKVHVQNNLRVNFSLNKNKKIKDLTNCNKTWSLWFAFAYCSRDYTKRELQLNAHRSKKQSEPG